MTELEEIPLEIIDSFPEECPPYEVATQQKSSVTLADKDKHVLLAAMFYSAIFISWIFALIGRIIESVPEDSSSDSDSDGLSFHERKIIFYNIFYLIITVTALLTLIYFSYLYIIVTHNTSKEYKFLVLSCCMVLLVSVLEMFITYSSSQEFFFWFSTVTYLTSVSFLFVLDNRNVN